MAKRIAVVMAGGSGERFWPLSSKERPKQLLRLTHPEQTMLEEAIGRISPLVGAENVFVATGKLLADPIRAAGALAATQMLVEPMKRNTLGALAWVTASLIARGDEDATLAILTADHKIGDPEAFRHTAAAALAAAEETASLITIGIRPSRPETGYGYIEHEPTEEGVAHRSRRFREKPDLETARRFVAAGNFLWNSGMFFWTIRSFMNEMSRANPEVYMTISKITLALQAGDFGAAEDLFGTLPNQSIDYALLEKAERVYVIPAGFEWDDVGAWDALERSMPRDDLGNVVQGDVIALDTVNSIVYNDNEEMLVATFGLDGFVVVVSKNAVLVCPKDQAQRVRDIVKVLEARDIRPAID